jgi:hypothetical protein
MALRQLVTLGALRRILLNPFQWVRILRHLSDLRKYRSIDTTGLPLRLYPCLTDATAVQATYGSYFYQDTWAAAQVFKEEPEWLLDVGSTVLFVGILSQFRPLVSVDIRPIQSQLPQ